MSQASTRAEAEGLIRYIDAAPTPYHACAEAARLLGEAGFTEVEESASWSASGRHYTVRGGSLIAWAVPERVTTTATFRLVGAHTDSPNLRIRPDPDATTLGYRQLRVEVYGGPLLNSWMDRDLGLAGRVAVAGPQGPQVRLLHVARPLLRIPQLAPHLDPTMRTEGLRLNAQVEIFPIWGLDGTSVATFPAFLAEELTVDSDRVLSWDVMAYDLAPSAISGAAGEFVSAPRLDNLGSAYCAIRAISELARAERKGTQIAVICLFDHEEVGSVSASGAAGAMLPQVLERVFLALGGGREEFLRALAGSVSVSADMAHAVNPNYPDRSDPGHLVHLNQGPAIKFSSRQRYATGAPGAATFVAACQASGTPYQRYVNRGDVPGGSTIGPLTAAWLGVETVDVGIPALAMHSIRELCGADDPGHLVRALGAFLEL
ncbi:MAG: M18 family aminopeptidase [Candidatus Dormibacteria bacterium]